MIAVLYLKISTHKDFDLSQYDHKTKIDICHVSDTNPDNVEHYLLLNLMVQHCVHNSQCLFQKNMTSLQSIAVYSGFLEIGKHMLFQKYLQVSFISVKILSYLQ